MTDPLLPETQPNWGVYPSVGPVSAGESGYSEAGYGMGGYGIGGYDAPSVPGSPQPFWTVETLQ